MKIHLVCTGNTFRSRMAEAYLRSKKIPELMTSSSGIEASNAVDGPITWYAQRIIKNEGLVPFESPYWTQTAKEILDEQDLIIFMQKMHYDRASAEFGYRGNNFETWDVEDLKSDNEPDSTKISESEEVYKKIVGAVDDLISRKL